MHYVFSLFRVIPCPMRVKGMEGRFAIIQPEKEFNVTDNIRGFYVKLEQTYIQQCKRIQVKELICKQDFTLLSRDSSTNCEAPILQPIRLIPQSCTQKIVDSKETLRISLRDNTWIYVAPVPERFTVLCIGQRPTDIEMTVSGVLTFLSSCTGLDLLLSTLSIIQIRTLTNR
jgi:hypothetical protein